MRPERAGAGLCQGPQAGLGERVGHVVFGQFAHALVDHIDDAGIGAFLAIGLRAGVGGLVCELLRQGQWGAQVRVYVHVPTGVRRAFYGVVFKDRGAVDQHVEVLAQPVAGAGDEGLRGLFVEQVGLEGDAFHAKGADLLGGLLCLLRVGVVVQGDINAALGQSERHCAAKSCCGACDQRGLVGILRTRSGRKRTGQLLRLSVVAVPPLRWVYRMLIGQCEGQKGQNNGLTDPCIKRGGV